MIFLKYNFNNRWICDQYEWILFKVHNLKFGFDRPALMHYARISFFISSNILENWNINKIFNNISYMIEHCIWVILCAHEFRLKVSKVFSYGKCIVIVTLLISMIPIEWLEFGSWIWNKIINRTAELKLIPFWWVISLQDISKNIYRSLFFVISSGSLVHLQTVAYFWNSYLCACSFSFFLNEIELNFFNCGEFLMKDFQECYNCKCTHSQE